MDKFTQTWIGYCAANGVTATPRIEVGDGLLIEGYVPPTNMIWSAPGGNVVQTAAIIQQTDAPQSHLELLQFAFGVPVGERVTWRDYLNPPAKPVDDGSDPVVGDVFDPTRRLYYVKAGNVQEGATYAPASGPKAGKRFKAVRIASPFTLHWQEVL
jgi:hypothetical protein